MANMLAAAMANGQHMPPRHNRAHSTDHRLYFRTETGWYLCIFMMAMHAITIVLQYQAKSSLRWWDRTTNP